MSTNRPDYSVGPGRPSAPDERTDGQTRSNGSLVPVVTVIGFGAAAVLVVIACAGLPGVLILLALGGVAGFIALQYLLWGWWLGNRIRQEEEAKSGGEDSAQ